MSEFKVIGEDDELGLIGVGGVLDRLYYYSCDVLKRDKSTPVRCRYPHYIEFLCKHIGARENITLARVYPSLVRLGYGIRYNEQKSSRIDMLDVADMISDLRASTNLSDRHLADVVDDIISFNGKDRLFRYDNNFIAITSNFAEKLNVNTPDLYLYYCLVGLNAVGYEYDYKHFDKDIGYIKASYELEKTDKNIKFVVLFIKRFL